MHWQASSWKCPSPLTHQQQGSPGGSYRLLFINIFIYIFIYMNRNPSPDECMCRCAPTNTDIL